MKRSVMLILLAATRLAGQDDGMGSFMGAKLEWSGNLDAKYTLLRLSPESPIARLLFFQQTVPSTASQYRLEPYVNASYTSSEVAFLMRLHATYYDDARSSLDLFEAYARYNPTFQWSLQAGKAVYTWGKGYAFNPAGFVNPAKDPENPELAQAGRLSAHAEYVTSFSSGAVQSFSALLVVMPPAPRLIDRFADVQDTEVALKLSTLAWDTDIDLMAIRRPRAHDRFGMDVSTNLMENLEVHAELAVTSDARRATIAQGAVVSTPSTNTDILAGIRFLNTMNTTIIVEYYRNAGGLSKREFDSYRTFLLNGASMGTLVSVQQTLQVSQSFFRTSTLMRDYVYVKATQPEPFDWLYLTPSVFAIVNINDGSLLVAAPVSYKPSTNIEFIVWPSLLIGDDTTEFGSRQARQRIEFWMRAFF